jgi:hypothetical protein
MRGTWQTTGSSGGGGLVLAVIVVAALVGSGALTAVLHALAVLLITAAVAICVTAVSIIALAAHRTRQDRPGAPIADRPVYRLPPEPRPQLEEPSKPAIGPGRQVHLHLNVSAAELAAIMRHYGGED